MKKLLFILIPLLAITFYSCDPVLDWLNQIDPPDPIEQDTCEAPILYTEPAFVTGFMIIDETVTTNVVIHVGPFIDSIAPGEDMSSKLKALLVQYDPNYEYQVYVSDTDWRRIAFIAKGTNDHEHYHGEVYLRFNQYHTVWGFSVGKQAFIFGGALNYD